MRVSIPEQPINLEEMINLLDLICSLVDTLRRLGLVPFPIVYHRARW